MSVMGHAKGSPGGRLEKWENWNRCMLGNPNWLESSVKDENIPYTEVIYGIHPLFNMYTV